MKFKITEDHITLLRNMYVTYDSYTEFGAPTIDPKRPYGNSNVFRDIDEILDSRWSEDPDYYSEDDGFSDDAKAEMLEIHGETATVLQIILCVGYIKTGKYVRKDKYDDHSWEEA